MAIVSEILAYAAKVAVDRLTGSSERTDEAVALFKNWAAQRNVKAVREEYAEARREASDQALLRSAIDKAEVESGQTLDQKQKEELEFSIVSGLSSVPSQADNSEGVVDDLVEKLHPDKSRGSYIIWMDDPKIVGAGDAGRYLHFSCDKESYRLRDYIGGRIFHPFGMRVTDKEWDVSDLKMSALQVWNAGKGQIRCLQEYGLYRPVTERDEWRQKLALLTEVARQFQQQ